MAKNEFQNVAQRNRKACQGSKSVMWNNYILLVEADYLDVSTFGTTHKYGYSVLKEKD